MVGRHTTKGFSWVVVVILLLASVTVAAAQPGDETPVKPPAPPMELIPQTPDVDPLLLDGDASEPAARTPAGAVPLWSWAGNFTLSGNLGVGTETPTARINVIGNTNGTTGIRVDNTNAGGSALTSVNIRTGSNLGVQLQKFGSAYNVPWNGLSMANWSRLRSDTSTVGLALVTGGQYPLVFGTSDIERARITPSGNLEVGTRADDTHRVTVRNSTNDNVMRLIGPDGGYGWGARLNFGDSDYVYLDEDVDDRLTIYAGGRTALMGGPVGVGTLTPVSGSKLDVESSGSIGTYSRVNTTSGTNFGVLGSVANTSSMAVAGFHPGTSMADFNTTGRGWWIPSILGIGANGVFGLSKVDTGIGVVGENSASSGFRRGVDGETRNDVGYGLYTNGNIYAGGSCTGCTMVYIAQNSSGETLTKGDVVAVRGAGKVLEGQHKPVLLVGKASSEDAWVVGVVQSRGEYYPANPEMQLTVDTVQGVDGDAAPGEYLLVVTSGLAQVRVGQKDALAPGAALTLSDAAGMARVADGTATVVFGHALEGQPNETGLIWAMIGTQ